MDNEDDDSIESRWTDNLSLRRMLEIEERRELESLPPHMAAEVRARYAADFAPLEKEGEEIRKAADAERYWRYREAEDPAAARLTGLLLQAKTDEDVFSIMQDIAGRFRSVANPEPEPEVEPDYSEDVPAVDANQPWRMAELTAARTPPDTDVLRQQIERQFEPTPTHDDPLLQRYHAEQRRMTRTPQEAQEGTTRRRTMLGTTSPEQRQAADARRRAQHTPTKETP